MEVAIYAEMEFPKKLQKHMKRLRLSQESLGRELGVSQSLVGKWVRGQNNPDIYQGRALAKVLGVSLDYLIDESIRVLEPEETEADRNVRGAMTKFGPVEVWEILLDRIGKRGPADRDAGVTPIGGPVIHPTQHPRPDDGRRVTRPEPEPPKSLPRRRRESGGDPS